MKIGGLISILPRKNFYFDLNFRLGFLTFFKGQVSRQILIYSVWTLFFGLPVVAFSQGINSPEGISEGELKKFATVKIMTSSFLESKKVEVRERILSWNGIKGGARYNEIKAAWGNSLKEEEVNITEEERIAFRSIANFQDSLQQTVLAYQVSLIKNEKMLGESTYFRVLEALKQDPSLKEKLDQLIKSLEKANK